MKLQIENSKGTKVVATGLSDRLPQEEIMKITSAMLGIIDMIRSYENRSEPDLAAKIEEYMSEPKVLQSAKETPDTPLIRPRIPNNVVDIKDLDIKQAVTEEALVRCPHCGQAHCLAVNAGNKIYVLERDFNKDEFNIIAEFDSLTSDGFIGMCCTADTDRKAYFEDLQSVGVLSYEDFAANNETEVFCPVCCSSHSFMEWKDAYDNPLKYFETEHLCDACGGEKVEKLVKNKKKYVCEKCGLTTDFKEE